MPRAGPFLGLMAVGLSFAGSVAAAEFTPKIEGSPSVAQPAEPPPPARSISGGVADKLASFAPKYVAPSQAPKAAAVDLREIDKPRNTILRLPNPPPEVSAAKSVVAADLAENDSPRDGILRLPRFMVHEERMPRLKDRDLLTPKAKIALGYQQHPALKLGNFLWFLGLNNDGIAAMMVEEDLAIERRKEFYDLAGLLPGKEGKRAKALADEAFAGTNFSSTH